MRTLKPARWHNPLFNQWAERDDEHKELARAQLKLGYYRSCLRNSGTEIELRNQIIRTLTSFTYHANKTVDPVALLELALSQALKTSSGDAGAIILFDQETNRLTVGAHSGMTSELLSILTGRRLDDGAILLMPHLAMGRGALLELTERSETDERRLLEAANLKSLASLPLQAGHRLLGALVVGTRNRGSFLPADLNGLLAIAQETAAAWESLQLRERLWQMAETLLDQRPQPLRSLRKPSISDNLETQSDIHPHASFEQSLPEISKRVGASMAAIIAIGTEKNDPPSTLLATHGLSGQFNRQYARSLHSDRVFPFDQLRRRNLLVKDLTVANAIHAYPMLVSLELEGARSLLALHLDGDSIDPGEKVIIVAANTPDALNASHLEELLTETKAPPRRADTTAGYPGLGRHVLATASEATADEVAMLRSAVTSVVRNAKLKAKANGRKLKAKANGKMDSLILSNQALRELNTLRIEK